MFFKLSLRATLALLFSIVAVTAIVLGIFIYQIVYTGLVSEGTSAAVLWGLMGVFVSTSVVGLLTAFVVSRRLRDVKDAASRFANGDLSRTMPVGADDEIGKIAETFNHMSERLRDSYQRLALENRRDEILLESMGEGLIAIDEKANIVLINNNARTLLNIEDKDIVGKPVHKAFTLHDKGDKTLRMAQRPEMQTLHTLQPRSEVFKFKQGEDNRPVILNISANPVIVDEASAGAIIVVRDVTREKEVDRMKTEFISLASHQLRTPLSAIKWFSEMLISGDAGKLKPEQADFAKNIYDSSERMILLVSSLLNISRIESGRIIVDPKPTDLGELVQGIINDLRAKIEERQHTMIVSVHKDLPKIKLDPHLIGQVYLNLLTNAIKYTPKGGEITVLVSKKDDQVVSQISDNGYGIPKLEQKKLFQKFFRAQNAVKVETDGTGLGLYLIKAIVESSNGKIWFDSEEGKGSTFWFSLPLSGMKAKAGEVTLDS